MHSHGSLLSRARIPLAANLALLKKLALAQVLWLDAVHRRLHGAANGLDGALQVLVRNAARAENVAVGKVLRGQVADGQLAHARGRRNPSQYRERAVSTRLAGAGDASSGHRTLDSTTLAPVATIFSSFW